MKKDSGIAVAQGRKRALSLSPARLLGLCLLLVSASSAAHAQTQPQPQTDQEARDFTSAERAFKDGSYSTAAGWLSEFIKKYPQSERLPHAVLLSARAAFQQQNTPATIELLTNSLPQAGTLADEYHLLLGEAWLQSSNYLAAAETFNSLLKNFPTSSRRLDAAYAEALARFKHRDWPQVKALLEPSDSAFQQAARARSTHELVARGYLLLGETLLETGEHRAGEAALEELAKAPLVPELAWQREYLLARLQLAGQRYQELLATSTNLVSVAIQTVTPKYEAESHQIRALVLERLNRLPEALAAYEQNTRETAPKDYRRHAWLKMIELHLHQNQFDLARERLETFRTQFPGDAAAAAALLTLGEVQLKESALGWKKPGGGAASTNLLVQAMASFDKLLADFPQSPLAGRSQLNRAWGFWLEDKWMESQAAFQAGADKLPFSEEQAVARFKSAEIHFLQNRFTNAIANFEAFAQTYADLPRVKNTLLQRAHYYILRASLETGELARAETAMRHILDWSPASPFVDRGLLLLGQQLIDDGRYADARTWLGHFAAKAPESPLAPEVELAIAQSLVEEEQWPRALQSYQSWIARFPTNSLLPQAEFNLAWAHYLSGAETNALNLFTNFVVRFATNGSAPLARIWIADYYYRHGQFVESEVHFQNPDLLRSDLRWVAIMMAGRAAFARQAFNDATNYFIKIIDDTTAPRQLVAEALFALGDTFIKAASPTDPPARFEDALRAFERIDQLYKDSPLAPLARGRMGDCYLQLGQSDPKHYELAAESYQQVVNSKADPAVRSLGQYGLATVLEKQAAGKPQAEASSLLQRALGHYQTIFYGRNLHAGEEADPYWIKRAALDAARLAEAQKDWTVAINTYERLGELMPNLKDLLERRVDKVRSQSQAGADRE